ncbi:hypothetical protein TSOC_010934 [Tetrabaena socialis]|uniref:Cytochrome P450 n=1 Tax=Tetrabaena socialis TaxID=47790 RepID=A0A2J7ZS00_9CHLO|nr:hypothetical protein TSOC_010934 [Tetrabaena socialis]|eukprot:PNH03038.1 hypothetical protein TSOC_010934 [Tetrabaena socialis]
MRNLQQRAEWAAERREGGQLLAERVGVNWLVCPAAAAELLRQHDGGAGAGLVKPDKHRKLLLHASLTGVSGADWTRQRPAFVAAAGGGPAVQRARHGEAVAQAAGLAVDVVVASSCRVRDVSELAQRVAARGIVGAVVGAAEEQGVIEALLLGLIRAVRVPRDVRDAGVCNRLEAALAEAVQQRAERFAAAAAAATAGEPRQAPAPVPGAAPVQAATLVQAPDPGPAAVAAAATSAAATSAAATSAAATSAAATSGSGQAQARAGAAEASALLPRLLAQPALALREAVCNANSSLMAGFETTFLLIACSLLHLAQRPDVQDAARSGLLAEGAGGGGGGGGGEGGVSKASAAAAAALSSRLIGAILKETLRVNPPVMGQPRKVVALGGLRIPLRPGPGAVGVQQRQQRQQQQQQGGDGGGEAGAGKRAAGGEGQGKSEEEMEAGRQEEEVVRHVDLPYGFTFAVDLLSAAHGWRRPTSATAGDGITDGIAAVAAADGGAAAATVGTAGEAVMRAASGAGGGGGGSARGAGVNVGSSCCPCPLPHRKGRSPGSSADVGGKKAAAGPAATAANASSVQDHPSWVWDPLRKAPEDGADPDPYGDAAPFGIGPRACPAGSLSLVIAREVLTALLRRYSWRLARAADADWMRHTTANPTLLIRLPLSLDFAPL